MIRILQVNAGNKNYGGVSAFLFELYSNMDHSRIVFDFLSPIETTYAIVSNRIAEMGGHVYGLGASGPFPARSIRYVLRLSHFLHSNEYEIIHINSGSIYLNFITACVARYASNAKVIIHSHNAGDLYKSSIKRWILEKLKIVMERRADYLFACSKKAASYMFTSRAVETNQVRIIHNGIDSSRFVYSKERREQLRAQMGLSDCMVIGNIGRFVLQKNQSFLLDVFKEVRKSMSNAVLLIYGEGELENELKDKIRRYGLSDYVRVLSPVSNIEDAYMLMDVFMLTSLHEGLPITSIEAQAMGLPVVLSDVITEECDITGRCRFLSLNDHLSVWAETIYSAYKQGRNVINGLLWDTGYDMIRVSEDMERTYVDIVERG